MKSADKIQIYHDVLMAVVSEEIDIGLPPDEINKAHAALDALCWVLDHEHNPKFEENMRKIMALAERKGYKLTINFFPVK